MKNGMSPEAAEATGLTKWIDAAPIPPAWCKSITFEHVDGGWHVTLREFPSSEATA
jgi:hypothetical protein